MAKIEGDPARTPRAEARTSVQPRDHDPPNSGRDPSRTRILDAAAAHLRNHGLTGAKLSDIAQTAGMLAPSLYHHFPSKNHLVEEVMLEGIYRNTRFIASHVEVLGPDRPSIERLRAAILAHIEFLLTGDDYSSAVARVFPDLPTDIKQRVNAAYSGFENYWRDLIKSTQKDGTANAALDATVFRKFLIPMLNSASTWYRPGKLSTSQIAAQAADIVLGGFESRPRRSSGMQPGRPRGPGQA